VADTSRTPHPDIPVPPGGGAGERLREFLAAREDPARTPPDEPPSETEQAAEDDEDPNRSP
jgi:hypothetical protein